MSTEPNYRRTKPGKARCRDVQPSTLPRGGVSSWYLWFTPLILILSQEWKPASRILTVPVVPRRRFLGCPKVLTRHRWRKARAGESGFRPPTRTMLNSPSKEATGVSKRSMFFSPHVYPPNVPSVITTSLQWWCSHCNHSNVLTSEVSISGWRRLLNGVNTADVKLISLTFMIIWFTIKYVCIPVDQ